MNKDIYNVKLTFHKQHKSIKQLNTIELPDFTVLTGLNGSGKTHLLEAIEKEKIKVDGIANNNNQIRLFDFITLVPNDSGSFDIGQHKNNTWNQLCNLIKQQQTQLNQQLENLKLPDYNYTDEELIQLSQITETQFLSKFGNSPENKNNYSRIQQLLENYTNAVINQFIPICVQKRKFELRVNIDFV